MKLETRIELLVERVRKWLNERVAELTWGQKRAILVVLDFFLLSFAVWLAFSIRLAHWVSPTPHQWAAIFLAPVVAIPIFVRMGLYRSVIRYLPERAFWTIARAVVLAVVVWIGVIFLFELARVTLIPRSIVFVYGLVAVALVGSSRFAIKLVLRAPLIGMSYDRKVILYGAGRTGVVIAEALRREHSASIVAFVDDNPDLSERDIAGTRVYPASQIKELMEQTGTNEVVLCMPSISASRRAEIVSLLTELHAKVRVVPAVSDLVTGRYIISQMREIDIDDLLGRSAVPASEDLMRETIENKSILVTGGGGSIGAELCRLFVKWKPRELIILEQSEFALYEIDRHLRRVSSVPIVPVLGSVTNRPLVEQTLRQHAVQVVFHAAAHKHVPMVEANAIEGIRNNVFGTQVVVSSCFDAEVERFVLISTDKAVRPSNVMGATKRAAEMIMREFAERAVAQGRQQKFCAVRFGNVLGSNGSVVPLFKEQIAAGGPVTLTDENMTRYFMSIHEAAELIVQAGGLSEGGDIFVLDMGEPVRIRALAEQMVHLAGLTVRSQDNIDGDIEIVVVGRRPGEKLSEELFYDLGTVSPTRQPKIMRAKSPDGSRFKMVADLDRLTVTLDEMDSVAARGVLFEMISKDRVMNHGVSEVISLADRKP